MRSIEQTVSNPQSLLTQNQSQQQIIDASSNTKTIALFSPLYLPSMGGVETYTGNLAKALFNLGWNPVIITMNTHDMPTVQDAAGIQVIRLPCVPTLHGRYPLPCHNIEYRNLLSNLKKQNIDYVVVNTRFYPLSYEGLAFSRSKNITPILIEHGSAHLTIGGSFISKGVEAIEHIMTMLDKRHQPICYGVSKKSSNWLSHFNIQSHGELPNAIDADTFVDSASTRNFREELRISDDELLVAFAGRLISEKGAFQMAQAMDILAANKTPIHAIMAGIGPLEKEIAARHRRTLHLVGRLDRSDLAALLDQADILCLPSRSEGFATTLLEAAAFGTPAVVTNVGGTDELIPDERFGTLILDAKPTTIAAALTKAHHQRSHITKQGGNVARRVRQLCSWAHTAQLVIDACEQAQEK